MVIPSKQVILYGNYWCSFFKLWYGVGAIYYIDFINFDFDLLREAFSIDI